jgi:hypothetical protein
MTTPDIAAAMQASMDQEDRRRELASQSPGLGALMQLPPTGIGAGVGLSDVPLPVIGESHQAAPCVPQHKAYGPVSPTYAPDVVGGLGYAPGDVQTALRALGPQDATGRADVMVVSPDVAPRRSLWSRLFGRR